MADLNWKKSGLFAAGVLFGTAGIKALSSKDAKKLYTNCTAAVLRAKDCVMKTVTTVQENCGDIYEGAKQINEDRAAAEETFEDTADEEETPAFAEQDYYIVSRGESLLGISKKLYGKDYTKQLCERNGLEDENKIYAGQKLLLLDK